MSKSQTRQLDFRMAAKDGKAEVWIFDIIGDSWLGGISADTFRRDLEDLGDVDEITVHINSRGGSVYDALGIYNSLNGHEAKIIVKIQGVAMSAASLVAMAGDEIHIAANGLILIHNPMTFVFGDASEMRKAAGELDKTKSVILGIYADRTGNRKKKLREWMDEETTFDADEAKEHGFVDSIIPNKSKAKATNHANFDPADLKQLAREPWREPTQAGLFHTVMQGSNSMADPKTDPVELTADDLKKDHPELLTQIQNQAVEAHKAQAKKGKPPHQTDPSDDDQPVTVGNLKDIVNAALSDSIAGQRKFDEDVATLCKRAGCPDKANEFIRSGKSLDEVRNLILNHMLESNTPPSGDPAADPQAKKDPDVEFKKEYADNREYFEMEGTSEEDYIASRRVDNNGGVIGPFIGTAAKAATMIALACAGLLAMTGDAQASTGGRSGGRGWSASETPVVATAQTVEQDSGASLRSSPGHTDEALDPSPSPLETLLLLFSMGAIGAAVTANQLIVRQDGCKQKIPVAASTRIYQGTLVYTTPAGGYGDDDTATGANAFAGIAISDVDNSSGSDGDLDVEVWEDGVFELTGSGLTQADVGAAAYGIDNGTIVVTREAAGVYVGKIVEFVSATKVKVKIDVGKGDPSAAIADSTDAATRDTAIAAIIDVLEIQGYIITT